MMKYYPLLKKNQYLILSGILLKEYLALSLYSPQKQKNLKK